MAPIFDRHCATCHGESKQKAGLRLDSFERAVLGGESGAVIKPDDVKASELLRRIKLPDGDDDVMPSDGKPRLTPDEIKIIELWIADGASATKTLADFPDAPVPPRPKTIGAPLAPDWRPRAAEIAALEKSLGVRLVPRSQAPEDGLVLRTASAPARCDDAALARLAPVADVIVEAELARTRVTDVGMTSLAAWRNLRRLDLTRTVVTSDGAVTLTTLPNLEALNLTGTAVDERGVGRLRALPALKRLWIFGTPADTSASDAAVTTK
ncbi:MAG: c-type cytochrome domain-containing protein [Opitutaceae bacterium]